MLILANNTDSKRRKAKNENVLASSPKIHINYFAIFRGNKIDQKRGQIEIGPIEDNL